MARVVGMQAQTLLGPAAIRPWDLCVFHCEQGSPFGVAMPVGQTFVGATCLAGRTPPEPTCRPGRHPRPAPRRTGLALTSVLCRGILSARRQFCWDNQLVDGWLCGDHTEKSNLGGGSSSPESSRAADRGAARVPRLESSSGPGPGHSRTTRVGGTPPGGMVASRF